MNHINNENSVYEYYIYLPKCQSKEYTLFNNLNKTKPEEELEKLSNLFTVKTNKYFFEIKNEIYNFGYFTLTNVKIDAFVKNICG